ncbi:hypothetical protein [Terrimonas pollutisoli]|uniref:hypothetical protein n=1 Tax=Terrimonas pollutisoli TaxID=3034147 RepID=UPI0023EDAFDA|nr:hypothetical protein [Terrimonas sp. H1YJ31]
MKSKFSLFFAITAIVFLLRFPAFALDGSIRSHDPSSLVKDGNKYYQFTTGHGIWASNSTNLFSWTPSPKNVFRQVSVSPRLLMLCLVLIPLFGRLIVFTWHILFIFRIWFLHLL